MIVALEDNSQHKKGGDKQEGEILKKPVWRRNRGNPVVTQKASGGKCKEPG